MKQETDFEWEKHLRECLDSTLIAVLATREDSGVWASPVYFCYDGKFNFYFISPKETRHMKDIKKDDRVALTVISPASITGISQIGVQLEGIASEVPDKEIEEVYRIRSARMTGDRQWVPESQEGHFVKEHGGVFMRIKPISINYVDTRFFGGNSKVVPLGKLGGKRSRK